MTMLKYTFVHTGGRNSNRYTQWACLDGFVTQHDQTHEAVRINTYRIMNSADGIGGDILETIGTLDPEVIIQDASFSEGSFFHEKLLSIDLELSPELKSKLGIVDNQPQEAKIKLAEKRLRKKTLVKSQRNWDKTFYPNSSMENDPRFNTKYYPGVY